uniref:Candidate secreted effector n=1 Tax=Meloidogyne incognita TaxID=6306 RepID=A0A914N6B1_MELIC
MSSQTSGVTAFICEPLSIIISIVCPLTFTFFLSHSCTLKLSSGSQISPTPQYGPCQQSCLTCPFFPQNSHCTCLGTHCRSGFHFSSFSFTSLGGCSLSAFTRFTFTACSLTIVGFSVINTASALFAKCKRHSSMTSLRITGTACFFLVSTNRIASWRNDCSSLGRPEIYIRILISSILNAIWAFSHWALTLLPNSITSSRP